MTTNTRLPFRVPPRVQADAGRRDYFKLPPIYALIIGIDDYDDPVYTGLRRAAKDADDFCNYLKSSLHVPPANITNLRNKEATRRAILDAFGKLRDINARRGDIAIVIYFAGHGTRCEKPKDWQDWETASKYVEAICPADMNTKILYGYKSKDEFGDERVFKQEGRVPAIPDRTISTLLNKLSEARGDNITLILDCCHSAGANRSEDLAEPEKLGYVNRRIHNPPLIPLHYDDDIIGPLSRSSITAKGFAGKNHASHVLLAACGRTQTAFEHPDESNGVFTYSLLDVLGKYDTEDLTYTSLMQAMNMPSWQIAHCEGAEIHRRLFNHKINGADRSLILGTKDSHASTLTLNAGTAQGITVDSRFSVHGTNLLSLPEQDNPALGYLIVSSVDEYSSQLKVPLGTTPFDLTRLFYCKLVNCPASHVLNISSPDLVWLRQVITPEFCTSHSVEIVGNMEEAHFVLILENGVIYIDHYLDVTAQHIEPRSPFTIPEDKAEDLLPKVIQCAANFRFHLLRTNPDVPSIDVFMEMRELESIDEDSSAKLSGDNILIENFASITVDEDNFQWYGVTIVNQTDIPLYPHVFYFDLHELSIRPWYVPPKNTTSSSSSTPGADATLPGHSKLHIGYGESNVHPWSFWMREGEHKDVGFFKLFLTTEPANFESIEQSNPYPPRKRTDEDEELIIAERPEMPKMPKSFWTADFVTIAQSAPATIDSSEEHEPKQEQEE